MPASVSGLFDLPISTLLSSERARIATRNAVLLSKAATFAGYMLACGQCLRTCSASGVPQQLITF
jgi:hypothetical protein